MVIMGCKQQILEALCTGEDLVSDVQDDILQHITSVRMTGSQIKLWNRRVEFGIPHKLINSNASVDNLPEREILPSPCELSH